MHHTLPIARAQDTLNRRAFVGVVTGGLLAAPLAAEAQQAGKVFRVGFLTAYSSGADGFLFDSFRQGMRKLGYEEGRNVAYETRWAEGRFERLPALATGLVGLKLDVILVSSTPAALAVKKATRTLPIVRASRIAILHDPDNRASTLQMQDAERAGKVLGVVVQSVDARDQRDFDAAFLTMKRGRADALILAVNTPFIAHRRRLAELAVLHRLPMVTPAKEYAEAGGLLSYGADYPDLFRRAATYVDKILKGAKPADLPIEQPIKFELVINLKTAKALGLTIPPSLLQRADQVIE